MYFVYIIFSFNTGKYYTGSTENLDSRLSHHNGGYNRSTKSGIPWVIVKYFTVNNRTEALKLENKIKKRGARRFIDDTKN